jgi:MtN3 and saliva related transmembrane protein
MAGATLIGLTAAFCTTFALLPQLAKTWVTRSTRDISFGWSLVLTVGTGLWLIYGLLLRDLPLIGGNGLTFVLSTIILVFKLRYG